MLQRTLVLRLYPKPEQARALANAMELCRQLYNACLDERRWAYREQGISIHSKDQSLELPGLKEAMPEYKAVYSQVLQNVPTRLERAFDNYFRSHKPDYEGPKVGYPRYKGKANYKSLTYKQAIGFAYTDGKLRLGNIGTVRALHEDMPTWLTDKAVPRTCTLRCNAGQWHAYIVFDVAEETLLKPHEGPKPAAGLDMGLTHLVTLSRGPGNKAIDIENPRHFLRAERRLARLRKRKDKKQKGSANRRSAALSVARAEAHVANQRSDYLHKLSRAVAHDHGLVAVEDNLAGLAKGMLAKHVLDAGWGTLKRFLAYKCPEERSCYLEVDQRGTTQECSNCHAIVPKGLDQREHNCPQCHLRLPRDENSGIEIRARAIAILLNVVHTDCVEPGLDAKTPVEIGPLSYGKRRRASSVVEAGRSGL